MAKKKDRDKDRDREKSKGKGSRKEQVAASVLTTKEKKQKERSGPADKTPAKKKKKVELQKKAPPESKKKVKSVSPVKASKTTESNKKVKATSPEEAPQKKGTHKKRSRDAGLLFLSITHAYRQGLAELFNALKDGPVSASQWEILDYLADRESVTQQEMARALSVSEGNVTQMLAKMEKEGWISRRREWRTNYVSLTAAGKDIREQAAKPYEEALEALFAPLSVTSRNILRQLLADITASNNHDDEH